MWKGWPFFATEKYPLISPSSNVGQNVKFNRLLKNSVFTHWFPAVLSFYGPTRREAVGVHRQNCWIVEESSLALLAGLADLPAGASNRNKGTKSEAARDLQNGDWWSVDGVKKTTSVATCRGLPPFIIKTWVVRYVYRWMMLVAVKRIRRTKNINTACTFREQIRVWG